MDAKNPRGQEAEELGVKELVISHIATSAETRKKIPENHKNHKPQDIQKINWGLRV